MKRLVLVGAGHAHLYPLSRAREFAAAGVHVTLIAPGQFWYSGMGPGMVSRTYEPADDTVDVEALITRNGGTFLRDEVVRIDPAARQLHLRSGATVGYDALSLNVGSEVPMERIEGAAEFGLPVKPIKNLFDFREAMAAGGAARLRRIIVAGGGAAGAEVAANLWHLLAAHEPPDITVLHAGERLVEEATPKAAELVSRYLTSLGVKLLCGARAKTARPHELQLEDGRCLPFDHLLVAIGVRAPALLRESGLPCADDGSLRVNEHLQCTAHPEIFGAGDCVCFRERCLPRIGVYAVRQAPVLHGNLLAFLRGESLQVFKPQKRYLLILNLGDGTGLLTRGGFAARGRWAFWLKDWLDRRFVGRFQVT
ncbi:MAG: FAD-dependent oxidoreductase [Chthoniobacterales bacterium]|nr:FAD-dependent oxidoreductase [Chthoniobacterales bacterium]